MPLAGQASELKFYSYGIVAENKKLTGPDGKPNRVVEITPVEDLTLLDGEVKSGIVTDTASLTDSTGGVTSVQTTTANSVPATWIPLGNDNRFTAPDVRRGAQVVLYRFADRNEFFWTTLLDDMKLRKLETVIYAWSATQKEGAEVDGESYYFFEISTHRGAVRFHTSKANGEFCMYDIEINAKDGRIQITDDVGNFILFDSQERQIAAKNADDCYMDLNKKNLTIQVPETYTLRAKNKVEEIGETVKITSGDSITESTKAYEVNASDSLKESTGTYNLNASGTISEKAGGHIDIDGNGVKISHGVALA
jgi:hypothetical protein